MGVNACDVCLYEKNRMADGYIETNTADERQSLTHHRQNVRSTYLVSFYFKGTLISLKLFFTLFFVEKPIIPFRSKFFFFKLWVSTL